VGVLRTDTLRYRRRKFETVLGAIVNHTGGQELRINTESLKAYGAFVQRELHQNIGPMAARVGPILASDPAIAELLPSGDIFAMNAKYALCVDQMAQQLESLTTRMAIIADAATEIAAHYTTSDALAKSTVEGILPAFIDAIAADTPIEPPNGLEDFV
jgi:hypothetical protein